MLSDTQTLGNCGFTNQTARPQAPATVGLAFRTSGKQRSAAHSRPPVVTGGCPNTLLPLYPPSVSDDSFEQLRIEAFSTPPELPDVMKPQDSTSTANEQAVQ